MVAIDMPGAVAIMASAIALVGGAIGTGMAEAAIGPASLGLIAEKPDQLGIALVTLVIPETILILSLVVSILILLGAGVV